MNGQCVSIHREAFSAAEVEVITGISQVVLRDWRRRKFFQSKTVSNRALYYVNDLGYLMALHALTSQGVAVGTATWAASCAGPMIERFAELISVPADEVVFLGSHGSSTQRFLVVGHKIGVSRVGSLDDWVESCDERGLGASGVVIDCVALSKQIVQNAPRPVVSVKYEGAR